MPHQEAQSSKINSDYRKYYEEQTGEPIPEGWEVHHIDHDRSNNHIDNLVVLPIGLHKEYHISYRRVEYDLKENAFKRLKPVSALNSDSMFWDYKQAIVSIGSHIDLCEKVSKYIAERDIKIAGGFMEAIEIYYEKIAIFHANNN